MIHRPSFAIAALALLFASILHDTAAQRVTAASLPGSVDLYNDLAFSKDGRFLHEVQSVNGAPDEQFGHVRAVTYVASTGAIRHMLDLAPDTWFLSATSDGRTAAISVDRDRDDVPAHVILVDMETGRKQDVPSKWFDPEDHNPQASISGDGRLVSAYVENPPDAPMLVSVYNWKTKRLVARQSREFIFAGGFIGGAVTPDGKIAFTNNRAGSVVVDPKTGRQLATFNAYSIRSPDGAWIVEFPDLVLGVAAEDIPIKNGMNGKAVGKLDIQLTEQQSSSLWHGAFCGATGKFIAASAATVRAYELPSGKQIAIFPTGSWRDDGVEDHASPDGCLQFAR